MSKIILPVGDKRVIEKKGLEQILNLLQVKGYQTIGPTVRDKAVILSELRSISELPIGWTDFQEAGTYRLERSKNDTFFGYALGPHSWKKYLHPPRERLWQARRSGTGFESVEQAQKAPKYAFIGVRPCELSAMAILDNVFNTGDFFDPTYTLRRKQAFLVAVNCSRPAQTCFCVSMDTGPAATSGFDIVLTEVKAKGSHFFVAEAGSRGGEKMLSKVDGRKAAEKEITLEQRVLERARSQVGKSLDTSNLRSIFFEKFEHHRWNQTAKKCLACGNCTMVCPTCFCHSVEDSNSLSGDRAERWRRWDSCFTQDFSYMHGGTIRASVASRYRQWLGHKLATWADQFGTIGCVGCGRCITWCPVGIDISQEASAILQERMPPGLNA
jgi:sulfhydrogenase subunit beta (sulfur reductase)